MPNLLRRNLHLCLPTMIKRQPPPPPQPSSAAYYNTLFDLFSSSTPTNKSQHSTSHSHSPSPSSSSTNHHHMDISSTSSTTSSDDNDNDSILDSATEPDFTTIYASDRFFVSCPGQSNSIIHSSSSTPLSSIPSSSSSSSSSSSMSTSLNDRVEAVQTDSPDPFADFRRSMQEVVEAHGLHLGDVVRDNWNGLHELLLCYLCLNPKDTHKFIVGAFADLLGSLVPASSTTTTTTANANAATEEEVEEMVC